MMKASDVPPGEIFHRNIDEIEFPDRMVVRRNGRKEIVYSRNLPISMPDIKCGVAKKLGQGVYDLAFIYADGTEKEIHRKLIIEEDDRECPFVGHCSSKPKD